MENIITVEPANWQSVIHTLRQAREAFLLLSDPTHPGVSGSPGFHVDLYAQPKLSVNHDTYFKKDCLWLTALSRDPKIDRSYMLRKKPQKTGGLIDVARELFNALILSHGYEFSIDANYTVGRGITDAQSVYFVSNASHLPAALQQVFTLFGRAFLCDEDIAQMVAYATQDLKDGSVLNHNIAAGMHADVLMGCD